MQVIWRRRGRVTVVLAIAVWLAAVSSTAPRAQAQQETEPATADLERTITKYCATCHNERRRTAATASGVVLDPVDLSRVVENGAMWEKVVRKLRTGAMPPAGRRGRMRRRTTRWSRFSRRRWIARRRAVRIPAGRRRTG